MTIHRGVAFIEKGALVYRPPIRHSDRVSLRSAFIRAKKLQQRYATRLRGVAKAIDHLVKGFDASTAAGQALIQAALIRYRETITPWAEHTAERFVTEIAAADKEGWRRLSAEIGRGIEREIASAPIAPVMAQMKREQVELITSLPTEAAERVADRVRVGIAQGLRAEQVAAEIYETGDVTLSRAKTIARTETGRAATTLQAARAQHAGSDTFVWRTAGDADVRASHKKLNGTVHRWDTPPVCDSPDIRALPGCTFNCFPGNVRVSLGNGVRKIWRTPFDGQVVKIVTDFGAATATINHPILTQRGWVSAGEISQGDYLVQALNDAHLIVNRDKNQMLPTFDQVFRSFRATNSAQRKGRLGFDFHGHVPDADVDEVVVNDLLPNNRVPEQLKSVTDFLLTESNGGISGGFGMGGFNHVVSSNRSSFGYQGDSVLMGQTTHAEDVGSASTPDIAAIGLQSAFDDAAGYVVTPCQGQDTLAANVSGDDFSFGQDLSVWGGSSAALDCDPASPELLAQLVRVHTNGFGGFFEHAARRYKFVRVVDKSFADYSGHVFTMETRSGWFSMTSAGFIAQNCRCYADPQFAD